MGQDQGIKDLTAKLLKLEEKLRIILDQHKNDLKIAKKLQNLLLPNRVPEINGVKILARHIAGSETSHDTFDIITTKDQKELFIVGAWTPQFGLSSLLLQTLFHLQSLALLQSRPNITIQEIYNDIKQSITDFNSEASFGLTLIKIDLHTLKIETLFHGTPPLLIRLKDKSHFQEAEAFPLQYKINSDHDFQFFESQLRPGSRLFYVGTSWKKNKVDEHFFKALKLENLNPNQSLIEDLNHLLFMAEQHQNSQTVKEDITALALELDERKIHLA